MVKVRVRLYRGHDYDLLPLSEIYGAAFASIAKQALEALFSGKKYLIDITNFHYVPTAPVKKELANDEVREKAKPIVYLVRLSDKDCPGIESWFRGFTCGHRNNLVKLAIRRALGSFPMEAYRNDGWISAEQESKEVRAILDNIEKEEAAEKEAEKPKSSELQVKAETVPTQPESPAIPKKQEKDREEVIQQKKESNTEAAQQQSDIIYAKPVSYEQEYLEEDDEPQDTDDDDGFDVLGAFESLH